MNIFIYRHISINRNRLLFFCFILAVSFILFLAPLILFTHPLKFVGYRNYLSYTLPSSLIQVSFGAVVIWYSIITSYAFIKCKITKTSSFINKLPTLNLKTTIYITLFNLIFATVLYLHNFNNAISQILYPISILPIALSAIIISDKHHHFSSVVFLLINYSIIFIFCLLNHMSGMILYNTVTLLFLLTKKNIGLKRIILTSSIFIPIALLAILFIKPELRVHSSYHKFIKIKHHENWSYQSFINHEYNGFTGDHGATWHNNLIFSSTLHNKPNVIFLNGILHRMDHLTILAHVINMTPSKTPYLMGSSYQTLVFSPIPRALWHNKPISRNGYTEGVKYNLVNPNSPNNSWGLSVPAEAYANFGWWGFFGSAILIGLFLRFIYDKFITDTPTAANNVIAALVVFNMAQIESGATQAIGNTIHCLVEYLIIFYLISLYQRHHTLLLKFKQRLSKPKIAT